MSPQGGATPADAIRVWRGYSNPAMTLEEFLERLGTVFVPATVLLQIDAGLDGYLPTVLGGLPGKPASVPDETALVLWDVQQAYRDGFKTLGVRAYHLIHGAVYTPQSSAEFPVMFAGELTAEQPCHLFADPADWMHGEAVHMAGARPQELEPPAFRAAVAQALASIQSTGGLSAAIACAGDEYLVYWALGEPGSPIPGTGAQQLAALCAWSHVVDLQPTRIEQGLWEQWPGMSIASGEGFNMQFTRRRER
jgi:hypothetical protein